MYCVLFFYPLTCVSLCGAGACTCTYQDVPAWSLMRRRSVVLHLNWKVVERQKFRGRRCRNKQMDRIFMRQWNLLSWRYSELKLTVWWSLAFWPPPPGGGLIEGESPEEHKRTKLSLFHFSCFHQNASETVNRTYSYSSNHDDGSATKVGDETGIFHFG